MAAAPKIQAVSGTAVTAAPDSQSQTSDTRRRPKESTAVPAINVASTNGRVMAAATIDASVALCRCCNASHGKATIDMPVPAVASSVANKIKRAGPRLVSGMGIAGRM